MKRRSWVTTTSVVCRCGLEGAEDAVDLVAGPAVKLAGRLVGQQHDRFLDQGPGDGHPLLLAAGELPRAMVEPVAQTNLRQQFGGLLTQFGRDRRGA